MNSSPPRQWPFVLLATLVCTAAVLVGLFFGALASLGYRMDERPDAQGFHQFGAVLGAASGLVAGCVWCWIMIRLALRRPAAPLVGRGSLYGLLVGMGSTAVLHLGLTVFAGEENLEIFGIGLICGVIAGLIVGSLAGLACQVMQKLASRPAPPPE